MSGGQTPIVHSGCLLLLGVTLTGGCTGAVGAGCSGSWWMRLHNCSLVNSYTRLKLINFVDVVRYESNEGCPSLYFASYNVYLHCVKLCHMSSWCLQYGEKSVFIIFLLISLDLRRTHLIFQSVGVLFYTAGKKWKTVSACLTLAK